MIIIIIIIVSLICILNINIYFIIWHYLYYKQDSKILLENLELFKHCMDNSNIFFWLGEGTALGCIRDNSIIEHDSDVDVGVWYEDKQKFIQFCLPKLKTYGFKVLRKYPFSIYRKKNYIDIDFTGSGKKCMAAGDISKASIRDCELIMDTLEPFQRSHINDIMYYVPNMKYIERIYGSEWYIPKKNKKRYTTVK